MARGESNTAPCSRRVAVIAHLRPLVIGTAIRIAARITQVRASGKIVQVDLDPTAIGGVPG